MPARHLLALRHCGLKSRVWRQQRMPQRAYFLQQAQPPLHSCKESGGPFLPHCRQYFSRRSLSSNSTRRMGRKTNIQRSQIQDCLGFLLDTSSSLCNPYAVISTSSTRLPKVRHQKQLKHPPPKINRFDTQGLCGRCPSHRKQKNKTLQAFTSGHTSCGHQWTMANLALCLTSEPNGKKKRRGVAISHRHLGGRKGVELVWYAFIFCSLLAYFKTNRKRLRVLALSGCLKRPNLSKSHMDSGSRLDL